MRATLRLLQTAANAGASAAAGTRASGAAAAGAARARGKGGNWQSRQNRLSSGDAAGDRAGVRYLVIDTPFTALPTDVLRALKEVGAVGEDYPLSAITSNPVGSPRRATLTTTYHLRAPSAADARSMYGILSSRPLFAASSSRASAQPGRPGAGRDGSGVKDDARVWYTSSSGAEWARRGVAAARAAAPGEYSYATQAASNARLPPVPDAEWACEPGMSGRRVLLRGLPRDRPPNLVRDLVRDLGVDVAHDEGLRIVPSAPQCGRASYVVTCASVADATFVARRLNATPYLASVMGDNYVLRAHVLW